MYLRPQVISGIITKFLNKFFYERSADTAVRFCFKRQEKMGKRSKIAQQAYDIALPVAERMGYDLVDAEYKKEGSAMFLRLYIDKRGGVLDYLLLTHGHYDHIIGVRELCDRYHPTVCAAEAEMELLQKGLYNLSSVHNIRINFAIVHKQIICYTTHGFLPGFSAHDVAGGCAGPFPFLYTL